jgi:hypothetical protein
MCVRVGVVQNRVLPSRVILVVSRSVRVSLKCFWGCCLYIQQQNGNKKSNPNEVTPTVGFNVDTFQKGCVPQAKGRVASDTFP